MELNPTKKEKGTLLLEKVKIFYYKKESEKFTKNIELLFLFAEETKNKILKANGLLLKYRFLGDKKTKKLPILAEYITLANETKDKDLLYNANLYLTSVSLNSPDKKKTRALYKKTKNYFLANKKNEEDSFLIKQLYTRILRHEQKNDSAMYFLKKLHADIKPNNNINLCLVEHTLGETEIRRKNYTAAFNWFVSCYKLSEKIGYKRFNQYSYTIIFSLLNETKYAITPSLKNKVLDFFESDSLENLVKKVEQKLPTIQIPSSRLKTLETLCEIYRKWGNYEKAMQYKNKWVDLKIIKTEEEQLNVNNFMNLEIAVSDLVKEKEALKIKEKLNFTYKVILGFAILVVLLIGFFLWKQQKLKADSERLSKIIAERDLFKSNQEKEQLKKELYLKEEELNAIITTRIEKNNQISGLKETGIKDQIQITEGVNKKSAFILKDWTIFIFKFKQLHPNF